MTDSQTSESSQAPNFRDQLKSRLRWGLSAGLTTGIVTLVVFSLQLVLANAQDEAASEALRAILYVALTCFLLNLVYMVWILSLVVLGILEKQDD